MSDFKNWTKEEFKVYLLIYAAQSNFLESNAELKFIESKFDKNIINKIHKEISEFKDYQKSQVIIDYIKLHDFSQKDLDNILLQIKEIYDSDGSFDVVERQTFYMLEKILKIS